MQHQNDGLGLDHSVWSLKLSRLIVSQNLGDLKDVLLNSQLQTNQAKREMELDVEKYPAKEYQENFDKPDFKRSIVCLEDLQVGTVLTGKVENATLFGIFVDIGVGRSGLIPIRNVTEAKLSKTKKRRSLGLGPGERVEVQVLNIDIPRSRITLDLIRVL
eukprot:bmy_00332T0